MKYIVLVGDGMSGRPLDELNGRTTLEVAEKPYMDAIVKNGKIGTSVTIPKGLTPGSDVANLSIIGYNPKKFYSGRGPFEAANMGVELESTDVAFRCNLITEAEDKVLDYSAGHISTKEAGVAIEAVDKALGTDKVKFYPGVSYRHLAVVKAVDTDEAKKLSKIKCFPPHDITGKSVSKHMPSGEGFELLARLMKDSRSILSGLDVNRVRIDLGENPANMIWLWGQGMKPEMPPFEELYGARGSIISAVNLINGIGKIIGLDVITVPGATGYYDTNFKGKGEYALKSLENKDFVFVHVEAPDEAGHNGDIRAKITAIENFDKFVVGTIWEEFKARNDYRIMVLPDHATPIEIRTHARDPIPFAVCGKGIAPDTALVFTEKSARASRFLVNEGHLLMKYLMFLDTK